MKDAKERASGAVKRDWEVEAHRSQVSWTARTGRMIGITTDGIDCGPCAYSLLNQLETLPPALLLLHLKVPPSSAGK